MWKIIANFLRLSKKLMKKPLDWPINNRLKGLNNWLETIVKTLEEKLQNCRNDFETLELIYKTLLVSVTQNFVITVNLLKIRFIIL